MAITKVGDKYRLDIRPDGVKGKRIIKLFQTRQQAKFFEKQLLAGTVPDKSDNRKLSEFIHLWYELHGKSLKSSVDTRDRLLRMSFSMGDPVFSRFSVSDYAIYRKNRLDSGISESTLNRELSTFKALYRELKRLQVIEFDLSLLSVRKLKESRTELSYLQHHQINQLIEQVNQSHNESLSYVFQICLATGARWSEAESLEFSNLVNSGFYFVDTKNGYSRFVPVQQWLFDYVHQRLKQGPFCSCYGAFRSAFKRAGLIVPKGQLAHILRHTFAENLGSGTLVKRRFLVPDRRSAERVLGAKRREPARHRDTPSSHLEPKFRPLVGSGRGDEDESGPLKAMVVA